MHQGVSTTTANATIRSRRQLGKFAVVKFNWMKSIAISCGHDECALAG
jgi:hypothetical protein